MKVVEINATYGFGSTGLIIRDIGEVLKANGDEVRFAYQMGECPEDGFRIGSPPDWKLHALFTRLSGMQGWGSSRATKNFLAYLEAEKPDVVHLHNLHANYVNLPLLLDYLAAKKIAAVVTLHDCWFFTGKCCHFVSANCGRWQTGCGHCPKQKEAPGSLFFDQSAYVAAQKAKLFHALDNLTVVGCSKWISNLAQKSAVFRDCRVEQIYNGVDTKIFAPLDREAIRNEFGLTGKFVILGMANKWLDCQNAGIFQQVIQHLQQDEKIILAGCSEEQKTALRKFHNVIPVGFIRDRMELARYYNAADVFVNLTFEDTLPTVNMEAVCCGTPVVTYDSCGSPELVQEGQTGFVIPQLDGDALMNACRKVKDGAIERSGCRNCGVKRYDKHSRYHDYAALFHRVIETR